MNAAAAPGASPRKRRRPSSADRDGEDDGKPAAPVVVLLSRDEHVEGRWVTALVKALTARAGAARVRVLPLSAFRRVDPAWGCLVNRVSDAAPPGDVKRCAAALRLAALRGIPCVNGGACFPVGTSKLMHHELFDCVGVDTPKWVTLARGMSAADAVAAAAAAGLRYPLLVKPNSGGFGNGIVSLSAPADLTDSVLQTATGDGTDGLALLQQFESPRDGYIYRVFFLGGEVQCAVRVRSPTGVDGFNACVCSRKFVSWDVPADVAESVRRMAALARADCGSVELMYLDGAQEAPLYFDFNLLSTLPDQVSYEQLADMIMRKACLRPGRTHALEGGGAAER